MNKQFFRGINEPVLEGQEYGMYKVAKGDRVKVTIHNKVLEGKIKSFPKHGFYLNDNFVYWGNVLRIDSI